MRGLCRRLVAAALLPLRAAVRCTSVARLVTQWSLRRNAGRPDRKLEIGPGPRRIKGFETLSICGDLHIDYVVDASRKLPFPDNTFALIYASHVLEHVPWYQTEEVLREWVRVLRPRGVLEIWVPDALKICAAFVEAEESGGNAPAVDPWRKFNPGSDSCVWATSRLFTYGDGKGALDHPNWHRAMFTSRYLQKVLIGVGLRDVRQMTEDEVRGHDHGWINLGVRGVKP